MEMMLKVSINSNLYQHLKPQKMILINKLIEIHVCTFNLPFLHYIQSNTCMTYCYSAFQFASQMLIKVATEKIIRMQKSGNNLNNDEAKA